MQNSALASYVSVSENLSPVSQSEMLSDEKSFMGSTLGFKIQGTEAATGLGFKPNSNMLKAASSHVVPEFDCGLDRDVNEGATFGSLGSRNTNGPTDLLGKIKDLHLHKELPVSSAIDGTRIVACNDALSCINHLDMEVIGSAVLTDVTSVSGSTYHIENNVAIPGSSETFKLFLDLAGDYDTHFRNLQYGQFCHGYAISSPVSSPPLSPQLPNKNSWESIHKSIQLRQNLNCRSYGSCVALGAQFYLNPSSLLGVAFGEENKRPRGTGTYIPNVVLSFVNPME